MGKAPPQLVVLLWHHAIYYKRHWIVTIWTITKPLLLFCVLYFVVGEAQRTGLIDPVYMMECSYASHSGLTNGPLAGISSFDSSGLKLTYIPPDVVLDGYQQNCLDFPLLHTITEEQEISKGPQAQRASHTDSHYDSTLQNALKDLAELSVDDMKKGLKNKPDNWVKVFFGGLMICNETTGEDLDGLFGRDEDDDDGKELSPQVKHFRRKMRMMARTRKLLCQIIQDQVLFYPQTNKLAVLIIKRVNHIIEGYYNFLRTFNQTKMNIYCRPDERQDFIQSWKPCNKQQVDEPKSMKQDTRTKFGWVPWTYYNYGELPKDKYNKKWYRGFDSLEDLQEYTKTRSKRGTAGFPTPYIPNAWGVLSFNDLPENVDDPSKPLKYSILYDINPGNTQNDRHSEEAFWLQELVERAIVEVVTEQSTLTRNHTWFGTVYKKTPNKCWQRPPAMGYKMFLIILSFGSCFAFLSPPATFLSQILMEKQLKMREYLYITGVGSFTLKLSWILFYSGFLIPLSIVFTCLVVTSMSTDYLTFSDPIFLYILLTMYNFCMLCFCYMLSSLINDPKSSTQMLYCVHVFVLVLCVAQFSTDMPASTLFLARICSFHPVVPLVLGYMQMIDWEKQWQGITWASHRYSPSVTDSYGGVGEAITWLAGDICLYLFLAWYFEKIFPGEFGQRLPFYFVVQPSYWCPQEEDETLDLEEVKADLEHVDDREDGIVIDKMTKVYGNGKVGLNQLTLTFYKEQICAFLGHNGAGKSTCINCLVGLINPTSGGATVHGLNILTKMEKMRRITGFVPQYDILYPDFTVSEHLQFFGWLKGLSKKKIKATTEPLLEDMQIDTMINQITTRLSGGQKRKLSIITAYLGSPKVIIFDEPTSGVDCFSRRTIWETILNHKKESTIILSTHFMDEADLLGDRIAIIHEGNLKCAGSPMYLKAKYGRGYRLTVTRNTAIRGSKEAITKFIATLIPEATFTEEVGQDLDFQISKELAKSDAIIGVLERIESQYNNPQYGIVSYGLHEPTIEEVFFSSIKTDEDQHGQGEPEEEKFAYQVKYRKGDMSSEEALKWQARAMFQKRLLFSMNSVAVFALQTLVPFMFILMLAITGSDTSAQEQLITIHDPTRQNILFVQDRHKISGSFIENAFKFGTPPPICPGGSSCLDPVDVPVEMSDYKFDMQSIEDVNNQGCHECSKQCQQSKQAHAQPHGILPSGEKLFLLDAMVNVTNWMIAINQSTEIVVGGFIFQKLDDNVTQFMDFCMAQNPSINIDIDKYPNVLTDRMYPQYVTLVYQDRVKQAVLNMWHSYFLRMKTNKPYQIELKFEGHMLVDPSTIEVAVDNIFVQVNNLIRGFWVIFALNFGTFGVLIAIHYETSTGLKRMQMMSGANPFLYWGVNIFFDIILQCLTVLFIVTLIALFPNPYQDFAVPILIIGLCTSLHSISFFYILSTMFSKSKAIVNLAIFISLLSALLSLFFGAFEMMDLRCVQQKLCTANMRGGSSEADDDDPDKNACKLGYATSVNLVLSFIPAYLVSDSVHILGMLRILWSKYDSKMLDQFCHEQGCFCNMGDIYEFQFLGSRLYRALLWTIIYVASIFFLEWFDVPDLETIMPDTNNIYKCMTKYKCMRKMVDLVWKKKTDWFDEDIKKLVDEDVRKETERIESGGAENDQLVASHLRKCYKGMLVPAVVDLSFGVAKSEVFGLLGVNGAGKTTTFNMLTGFQAPTAGKASIMGYNLFGGKHGRFKDTSYCPQENTLFQQLTIEQHLKLFSAFRGIPHQCVAEIVDRLITETGLDIHRGKKAGQLSGGNQRKLNFAISLLDYRPVIFLDEPTSGMDPGARRRTWNAIKRAVKERGCSVVLTSHSMDECEALCHKIVIMVAGSFLCIGSVQYLKHKYGDKYQFKIKLEGLKTRSSQEGNSVKKLIKQKLPTSKLDDEHANVLSFHVPCSKALSLSHVYKVMSECRKSFKVEDISVSQTTLEQIFINMARIQEEIKKMTGTKGEDKGNKPGSAEEEEEGEAAKPQDKGGYSYMYGWLQSYIPQVPGSFKAAGGTPTLNTPTSKD